MFCKLRLYTRIVNYILAVQSEELSYAFNAALAHQRARFSGSTPIIERDRTIVIIGASFAGHHVARLVAGQLPPKSRSRVVVVEPNSHFHFTWLLPRFCIIKDHEHKAFIPCGKCVNCLPGAFSHKSCIPQLHWVVSSLWTPRLLVTALNIREWIYKG